MKRLGFIGYGLRSETMMKAFSGIAADIEVAAIADPNWQALKPSLAFSSAQGAIFMPGTLRWYWKNPFPYSWKNLCASMKNNILRYAKPVPKRIHLRLLFPFPCASRALFST